MDCSFTSVLLLILEVFLVLSLSVSVLLIFFVPILLTGRVIVGHLTVILVLMRLLRLFLVLVQNFNRNIVHIELFFAIR